MEFSLGGSFSDRWRKHDIFSCIGAAYHSVLPHHCWTSPYHLHPPLAEPITILYAFINHLNRFEYPSYSFSTR